MRPLDVIVFVVPDLLKVGKGTRWVNNSGNPIVSPLEGNAHRTLHHTPLRLLSEAMLCLVITGEPRDDKNFVERKRRWQQQNCVVENL